MGGEAKKFIDEYEIDEKHTHPKQIKDWIVQVQYYIKNQKEFKMNDNRKYFTQVIKRQKKRTVLSFNFIIELLCMEITPYEKYVKQNIFYFYILEYLQKFQHIFPMTKSMLGCLFIKKNMVYST